MKVNITCSHISICDFVTHSLAHSLRSAVSSIYTASLAVRAPFKFSGFPRAKLPNNQTGERHWWSRMTYNIAQGPRSVCVCVCVGGGGGGDVPPSPPKIFFLSYKELVRKNDLCPPNIESLMVPPSPQSQSCSAVPVAHRALWLEWLIIIKEVMPCERGVWDKMAVKVIYNPVR